MKPISNNTAHIVIRMDAMRKDKTYPLYLRVKIAGRKKDISLSEHIPLEFWDKLKFQVKRSYPDAEKINQVIATKILLAKTIISRYKNNNLFLNLEDFENGFGYEKTSSFYGFIENEIKKEREIGDLSEGTISGFVKDLSKLKRYKPIILMSDLTVSLLEGYEIYMRNKLKNKVNTINRSFRFIRNFNNRAKKQGLTDKYPFDQKRLKTEPTQRIFLLEHEIETLTAYYHDLPDNLGEKNTLQAYLFCCYTGIRFSDASLLRHKDINNDILSIKMRKTKEIVTIPLLDKAKVLLQQNLSVPASQKQPEQLIFKMPCSQVANRQLKRSAEKAKINKHLTFHISRHTFGTLALTNDIPIVMVSKLMGHSNIKQTLQYAKIIDTKLTQDMEMWNTKLNIDKNPLRMVSTTTCLSGSNGFQIKRC